MNPARLAPVALLALLAITACGSSEPTVESETQMAGVMCEDFVERELKSPASAEFDTSPEITVTDAEAWEYEVFGSVDSENDFGAMKRTHYTCTISTDGAGEWTLVDLQTVEQ